MATSPATLQKRRDNHSHQSDEAVGQATTSRGRSHPPVLHQTQELVTRLHHAGEELSETLFNAMVLNGLPQRYEHFVVQESFNPAENFVELRKRLTNFEESPRQRDDVEEDQHVAMSAKNASHQIGIHSSFKSHPRKTFSKPSSSKGPRLCFVCNKPGHLATSCYKTDNAVCSICKAKGHLASACKHQQKSPHKGLASSLSAESSFEVSKTDLVVDSGSTDHMMIDKIQIAQLTIQMEGKQKLKE